MSKLTLIGEQSEDDKGRTVANKAHGMANLLLYAPQCIPFNNRVEIFRELIKFDKKINKWNLPVAEGGPPLIRVS